jgi:hypothetical protein
VDTRTDAQLPLATDEDRLGVNEPISRRDFLNGALLASAGLLLPGKAQTIFHADAFNELRLDTGMIEI